MTSDGPEEILDGPGEILDGPGEILDGPGEILDGPGKILHGPGEILHGPGEILDGPGKILHGPGEILHGPGEILHGPGMILHGPGKVVDGPGINRLLKVEAVIPEVSSCLRTSGALQRLGAGSSGMSASILISLYTSESLYQSLQNIYSSSITYMHFRGLRITTCSSEI